MEIRLTKGFYKVPKSIEKRIEERYEKENFINIVEFDDRVFIVYEQEFENLDIIYIGFLISFFNSRLSGFGTLRKEVKDFSYIDKLNAVKNYLNENDVSKFNDLVWLRDVVSKKEPKTDELLF